MYFVLLPGSLNISGTTRKLVPKSSPAFNPFINLRMDKTSKPRAPSETPIQKKLGSFFVRIS